MARRRQTGRGGGARPYALAASVIFHAALLLVLTRFLAPSLTTAEAPVMQVTLVAPPQRAPRPPSASKPERERQRRPEATTARATPVPDELPVAPRIAPPGDGGVGGRAQQALRGLAGCERTGLSREERARCETQRWARVDGAANPRLNLDRSGRYAENPEPFLSRRPTKGCRARATGDVDAMGDSGNTRAGVTCVIPF